MASKRLIEDYQGYKHPIECIGCHLNQLAEGAPNWVYVSENFHAHQDFEIPIPGFIIVATRRHIAAIDEFSESEIFEYAKILKGIRAAQRHCLGIKHVYFIQEEDTEDHFHTWLLPRHAWMSDVARFGKKVSSARPVLEYAREHMKTPETIAEVNQAALAIREYLTITKLPPK